MNYIGTYKIDIDKLELYTNKLNVDITKFKQDLELLNNKTCLEIIENSLLPVLDKYSSTMNELISKTKSNINKTVGENNE